MPSFLTHWADVPDSPSRETICLVKTTPRGAAAQEERHVGGSELAGRSLEPGSASLVEPSTPAADLKVWEQQVLAEETPLEAGEEVCLFCDIIAAET